MEVDGIKSLGGCRQGKQDVEVVAQETSQSDRAVSSRAGQVQGVLGLRHDKKMSPWVMRLRREGPRLSLSLSLSRARARSPTRSPSLSLSLFSLFTSSLAPTRPRTGTGLLLPVAIAPSGVSISGQIKRMDHGPEPKRRVWSSPLQPPRTGHLGACTYAWVGGVPVVVRTSAVLSSLQRHTQAHAGHTHPPAGHLLAV